MFSLCVLAPLCEELLFRVVIQGALSRAVPMGFAVLGTGALFAVYHGSLERVPEVLVLGLFLGVLYRRTGSYWQCVLLHFVLNTVGPPLFVIASQVSTPILIGVIPVAILIGIAALPRAANSGAAGDAAPASAIPRARSSRGIAVAILALVLASLGIETTLYATGALNRFDTSAFPSPGWCVQEWRLGSKGMFTVTERLTLRASEVPPSAIAPVATGAELVSAVVDGQPIVSERLSDTWMLQPGESENARRCVLVWTVPIASLKEEFGAYWVESRTPVAVCGFRVELVLEPGCGFEDAREPARRKEPVLFMNTGSEQCFSSLPRVGFQVQPAASFHIEGRTTR
jgi:hypothetical protein